jgi:molybdenum cofactor guanylyltransferase
MAITGLILAGGRGSRMGGADKGLQLLRGKPMVAHVIERLAPQAGVLAINANRNLDAYRAFGYPLWPDAIPEFEGPLAGLHTGLIHCETQYLATAPCDSPFLPMNLVARLHDTVIAGHARAAYAATGSGGPRQSHPVFCLLDKSLLPDLAAYLQQGGRRMLGWLASIDAIETRFDDESAFRNINTLEELQTFDAP